MPEDKPHILHDFEDPDITKVLKTILGHLKLGRNANCLDTLIELCPDMAIQGKRKRRIPEDDACKVCETMYPQIAIDGQKPIPRIALDCPCDYVDDKKLVISNLKEQIKIQSQ